MAIQTPNYNLKKPVGNEFYNIEDANANMDIIDEALKVINDKTSNIEVPVTSVNTKTGDIVLKAIDIKASDDKTVEEKLAENSTQMAELETKKIDKTAISDSVTSTSSTTVASSKSVKTVNDSLATGLATKINKPASALTNNIAIFNASKDVIDSGKKITDFAGSNVGYVSGYYTGDGQTERIINLGFTPVAVLVVECEDPFYTRSAGGFAVTGSPSNYSGTKLVLEIVANGFKVFQESGSGYRPQSNAANKRYNYIAYF
ncbi:hypothetical protein [Proteiniborus sp. MB09-C3]|uniref:hypothetical protein n=1 Tax=Proteiniborus sp. MB09-C3 TaxID=3050072 RepID=UPI002555E574|nr:hypothetical protein [Proteiniborus sp. MB09-C3]WIV11369.1 hypothetical protein QO263_14790 [Proteiniborus sp. MB09-C3]